MFVTRFAPSPTGRLHLGHAYSALTAFLQAKARGGRFILRMEDIDQGRCREEYEQAICEDLAWLGVVWDGDVRRQSEHFSDYEAAIRRLDGMGVVYRCFRTRREIAEASASAPHEPPADSGPVSRGSAHGRAEEGVADGEGGRPFAWRLSISACRELLGPEFDRLSFTETGSGPDGETGLIGARPGNSGDVVLARKDFPASYHLACVHDDALQGITHVIRGCDLFAATHIHVLIQRLLGFPSPIYRHHGLLMDTDGKRYAKRNRSVTLASLRAEGWRPEDIIKRIGLQT